MPIFLIGLIIFLGVHSIRIVAPGWRDSRYAVLGEQRWKGVYSIASLLGLILMIWGYSIAQPAAPVIYEPPVWMKHTNAVLMMPALILLVASNLKASRIRSAVKHPMLAAVKLWAFGHLLANGDLASILLFGSFLAWAVADRISVKRRPAEPEASLQPMSSANDIIAVAGGVLLYFLFVWKLHLWLFGAPPIAAG